MAKPKVFVSYDHSEDVNYKRLLQAWDAIQILISNSTVVGLLNDLGD